MFRAMIVDDEPYIRQMIRGLVDWQAMGFDVCAESFNGQDALTKIKEASQPYSLVITDIKMPVMDGLSLIRGALAVEPGLVFVVISAFDDFHLVKDAFKLGAREYLLKSEMTAAQLGGVLLARFLTGQEAADDTPHQALLEGALIESSGLLRYGNLFQYDIRPVSIGEYSVLLSYSVSETDSGIKDQLFRMKRLLAEKGVRLNAGVSDFLAGEGSPAHLMQQARLALDSCFLSGNSMNFYMFLPRNSAGPLDIAKRVERMRIALLTRHKEQTALDVHGLIVEKSMVTPAQIPAVKELYMHYCFTITEYVRDSSNPALLALLERYNSGLRFQGDLDSLNAWLVDIFARLGGRENVRSLVQRIKYYIDESYHRDISLSSIASRFEMNSSYLSRIFSQQAGVSFMDYLSSIRINKALDLMQNTNLKLYEIGERVGCVNPE